MTVNKEVLDPYLEYRFLSMRIKHMLQIFAKGEELTLDERDKEFLKDAKKLFIKAKVTIKDQLSIEEKIEDIQKDVLPFVWDAIKSTFPENAKSTTKFLSFLDFSIESLDKLIQEKELPIEEVQKLYDLFKELYSIAVVKTSGPPCRVVIE